MTSENVDRTTGVRSSEQAALSERLSKMTDDDIVRRLKALNMYESSVLFSMPDEGDLTTREMLRITVAKQALRNEQLRRNAIANAELANRDEAQQAERE